MIHRPGPELSGWWKSKMGTGDEVATHLVFLTQDGSDTDIVGTTQPEGVEHQPPLVLSASNISPEAHLGRVVLAVGFSVRDDKGREWSGRAFLLSRWDELDELAGTALFEGDIMHPWRLTQQRNNK